MRAKKAILPPLLAVAMFFAGCSGDGSAAESNAATETIVETTTEAIVTTTEASAATEPAAATTAQMTVQETEPQSEPAGNGILVAYFSATGNTERVALELADDLGADIYEIMPEQPYTAEDLNYSDSGSRATAEQNDPDARPAIAGTVENMNRYSAVFLGYPIWWGDAPRIMSAFVESYDFSGKTLVCFCTSGSSGFGDSDAALRDATTGATWQNGARFSGGASADEVMNWANELGVN